MATTTLDDMKEPYRQIEMRIDFGLNANNQVVQKEIPELVQYDSCSGLLVFDFYNKGIRVDLNGVAIGINFLLPSGLGIHDAITNIRILESRAMYFTPAGVLNEEGIVIGDVALYKDNVQITSSVKFKLNVIKGISTTEIVNDERYPILQQLMNQVQGIVDEARSWVGEFNERNEEMVMVIEEVEQRFGEVATTGGEQFITQLEMQDQEFDDMLTNKTATFDSKVQAIDTRFNQLYTDIDGRFNREDIDAKIREKYERLEEQYAQTYADTKATTTEIKSTCLKYRIVGEGEQ